MEQNNENQISSVAIYSYHSETNIGIALRAVPCYIGFLTAAIVTVGIPTATFDNMQSVSIGRGTPFPTISPKVNAATGTLALRVCIHSCQSTFRMTGIHGNILGHVSGGKHPFFFGGQAITVLGIFCRELVAVGFGILERSIFSAIFFIFVHCYSTRYFIDVYQLFCYNKTDFVYTW